MCEAVCWQPEAQAGAARLDQRVFPLVLHPGLEEWRCSARPALEAVPAARCQDETPAPKVGSSVCVGTRGGGCDQISRSDVFDCLLTAYLRRSESAGETDSARASSASSL